jgi:class 3 adenylate cyclase
MSFFGYPRSSSERRRARGSRRPRNSRHLVQTRNAGKADGAGRIDSGPVVVGTEAGKEADVFGDAPNSAARVQTAAQRGTVVITEATQRLVSGLFVIGEHGANSLKRVERRTAAEAYAESST